VEERINSPSAGSVKIHSVARTYTIKKMIFSQENPLTAPKPLNPTAAPKPLVSPKNRSSASTATEPANSEPTNSSTFSAYFEDTFKIKLNHDTPSMRNSFCSQGSNNSESTSSSFSSSIYLSHYLNSFRNSPLQSNQHPTNSVAPEQNVVTAIPLTSTSEVTSNHVDSKESPRHRNDRILMENTHINSPPGVDFKSHFDYYFADDGLIAYLPDKLALILKEAIYLFNLKPNSSKEFLRARKVISNSASDFAKFIFTHSSGQSKLSKRRIGEFLGNSHPYNQEVLNCFLEKFDFADMALDEAIRSLVRQFRLPGEAQQIDRILEKFANIYYFQNNETSAKMGASSTAIKSADVAYIISFSILMLNTDLHNPSVPLKNKMTVAEFIRNNRGINGGLDIPAEHLEGLYARIKNDEIKMDMADMLESDVPAFMAPIMAGYLFKLYHVAMVPRWKKRWFILNDGCLYYFNKPYETKPKCIMPLENIRIEVQMSSVTTPVNIGPDARTYSSGNLHEVGTGSATRRGDKGRVSFIENIGVESHSSTDCVLIVYGAASSGLLKSSKLGKKGGMTLAPRSRLVLKASSVTERDEWLAALQVDTPNFDPLKNASSLPAGTDKWKVANKTDPEKSSDVNVPKSRYDTDICSSSSSSNSNCTDQSHSVLSSYNRRHSQCSTHSELENEGSVDSTRSYVSWNSDHSGTSGEMSVSTPSPVPHSNSNTPEPQRPPLPSPNGSGNGVKWANPFGTSFQKPKNVSWPHAALGTEDPTSNKKVDVSAVPDSSSGRIVPVRKQSSSSILSFASGQSGTHSTHSAHSDETILFGMSEVLLEGTIYRYVVPAKLNASSSASETGLDDGQGLMFRGSDDAADPQPTTLGSPIEKDFMDDRTYSEIPPLPLVRKTGCYSSPDFTSHRPPITDGIASSIRNTHSMEYNTVSTRHSLSSVLSRSKLDAAYDGVRRRNSSVSAISDPPSRNSNPPPSDIIAALTAARAAVSALIAPAGSGSSECPTASESSQTGTLEVAIPVYDYRSKRVDSRGGGTSDLTGDSSYSAEQDCVKDRIAEGLTAHRATSRPTSFSSAINLEDIVIDVDAIPASSVRGPPSGSARFREARALEIRGKQDDIPAARSPAASPFLLNASKNAGNRGSTPTPTATVDKSKMENDSDHDDTKNFRVKKVAPSPRYSDAGQSDDGSQDGNSPSFINPKRLDRYSEEPKHSYRESEVTIRGRRSSTGSSASYSGTNSAVPALSFASMRGGLKPLDVGDGRQTLNCPLGVDISMGSVSAHSQGQGPPSGCGSSSSPHPLGLKNSKHPSGPNGLRDVKKWRRMHLTLLSDTDGKGDILFYFPNEEVHI
jgi:hypothetical protein